MANETRHLIQAFYQTKGWDLYKRTVNASGRLVSATYRKQIREGNKVITTTKKMSKGHSTLTQTLSRATGKQNDFMKALKRAAIVAPVWLALRSVMMGVLRTLTQGAKYWEDFDKAVMKSKQVIHGAVGTIDDAMGQLEETIRSLSVETGENIAKLSSTFYRFGTVGLDFQASMQGMETSTKLATVMFGNSDEIARVLAQAYRLLGDSINQIIPEEERLAVTGAQIFKLWKENAFEIGEFTGALQKFLPTANVFNFSMEESIALLTTLQTAGLKGSRAGRLLRTSINKLVGNLDNLAMSLGVHVNPELDTTFDVLMRVLKAIRKLTKSGGELPMEAFEGLGEFGGVRAKEAAMALVALYDTLLKNLKAINTESTDYNVILEEQEAAYQDILKSTHKQIERFRNLRKMVGEAFVKGVVGGENFADSMSKINDVLAVMAGRMDDVVDKENRFAKFMRFIERFRKATELPGERQARARKELTGDMGAGRLYPDIGRYMTPPRQATEGLEEIEAINEGISNELEHRLNLLQKELKYIQLEASGAEKSFIVQQKLVDFLKEKVRIYNETDRVVLGEVETLSEQKVVTEGLKGDYKAILELADGLFLADKDILKIEKQRQLIISEREKLNQNMMEQLIRYELNLLGLAGATASQKIKTRMEMEKQLGQNQDSLSILKKQLELEIAIKKEKEAQTRLSSETMKLYKITQRFGRLPAREIGQFLQGQISYKDFQQRNIGGSFEIFKQFFPQVESTLKALEFFKRELSIPIREEALRQPEFMRDYQARQRAEAIPEITQAIVPPKVDINTLISEIKVQLPEDSLDKMAEETGKQVIDRLKTDEKLHKLLAQMFRPYI